MDNKISIPDIVLAFMAIFNFVYMIIFNRKMEYANIENDISNSLTNAKNRVEDICVDIEQSIQCKDSEEVLKRKKQRFQSARESLLNAYEDACSKYNDKKVDKKRFRKKYTREIRQLVEDDDFKYYFNGVQSPYQAILKVYKEWNHLE